MKLKKGAAIKDTFNLLKSNAELAIPNAKLDISTN